MALHLDYQRHAPGDQRAIVVRDLATGKVVNAVGAGEKQAVHSAGLLHRAFSVFLLDPRGRLLLQRRAISKYHFAGRWSNACCCSVS